MSAISKVEHRMRNDKINWDVQIWSVIKFPTFVVSRWINEFFIKIHMRRRSSPQSVRLHLIILSDRFKSHSGRRTHQICESNLILLCVQNKTGIVTELNNTHYLKKGVYKTMRLYERKTDRKVKGKDSGSWMDFNLYQESELSVNRKLELTLMFDISSKASSFIPICFFCFFFFSSARDVSRHIFIVNQLKSMTYTCLYESCVIKYNLMRQIMIDMRIRPRRDFRNDSMYQYACSMISW